MKTKMKQMFNICKEEKEEKAHMHASSIQTRMLVCLPIFKRTQKRKRKEQKTQEQSKAKQKTEEVFMHLFLDDVGLPFHQWSK